ncbi:hypothetical protein [Limosilactobacillus antri]|nr:hypothetical protein [Limosilactobacillus antri]
MQPEKQIASVPADFADHSVRMDPHADFYFAEQNGSPGHVGSRFLI